MSGEMLYFIEVSLAGIGSGSLLALTALAFVLIYKSTRVINLAIGEVLILGGYLFLALAGGYGLPTWLALPMAVAGGGLVGAVVERGLIRPMLGESPISMFMVTVGLGSILVGTIEMIWGTDPRTLPAFIGSAPVFLGEAYVSRKIVIAFVSATIAVTAFLLFFRFWRGGVALRATASDQTAAYSCGINVPRVYAITWMISCATAAGGGILLGSISGISPTMGAFGLSALVVIIIGGLDSVSGALVGGLALGLLQAWIGAYLGGEYQGLVTFSLLLLTLVVRPYGLFGTHEIERL
ncbi:branched-chain amino acid ABC transporter permease (plasmid) [Agrobacterium leguminum]|uniref:High-affinity branched-chain amino acid transport system permease protein n=2 Tax=Agrobacterium deltaense TaxID=1183412 RepID=A0A1S7U7D2_9HYPH|nr:branched-chain amino acid ABC transporter permease [Agrobacterium leguminum]WFS69819.1 branched-chain amino acid ABC transporter permease [Agrobacterium leguminum]CVI62642.1 High-affinity branched-chain amino acid transport system permease protein [Agrobacterium deltaense NCPPB 1641]